MHFRITKSKALRSYSDIRPQGYRLCLQLWRKFNSPWPSAVNIANLVPLKYDEFPRPLVVDCRRFPHHVRKASSCKIRQRIELIRLWSPLLLQALGAIRYGRWRRRVWAFCTVENSEANFVDKFSFPNFCYSFRTWSYFLEGSVRLWTW